MRNLLEETLMVLEKHDRTSADVQWVGCEAGWFSWEYFSSIADFEYDSGYGGQEIAYDLIIVGDNFWLERGEYDGSEWWEFKTMFDKPTEEIKPQFLSCHQIKYPGWKTVADINGWED